jgi:hypothetical protein
MSPPGPANATPTLAETTISTSESTNGSANDWSILMASRSASCAWFMSSHRNTNSSPANRVRVSPGRTSRDSRPPTATRSSSPTRCPWLSFTDLKWSMSTNRMAALLRDRLDRRAACSRRCCSRSRLGSPVSGSCRALCRNRSVVIRASSLDCALSR